MKKRNTIVTFDPEDPGSTTRKSLTDWERLRNMDDSEIDFSDIPELDEEFFKNAIVRMPRVKTMVSIRLDDEVLEWFKKQGQGYQTRINAVLKAYMTASQTNADNGLPAVKTGKARLPRTARKVLKAPKGRKVQKVAQGPGSRKVSKARAASR